jgi:DNA processing protein
VNRPLAQVERIAWARLARTPRIGPISFARLIARFGGAEAALEALPALSKGRWEAPSIAAIEDELAGLANLGARLLCSCEPTYPSLLRALDPGPAMIAVRGDAALLQRPTVAIVGAREASAAGLTLAAQFTQELSAAGFVIVSGMARGIDAKVHAESLATGTVAVLAGGLDRPYPPQNLRLYQEIAARGCVVAEAPLGFQARARDFPRRNHLISGLSRGVVVIEAALRSGSLITAHAAADQGREVFAVPGSPLDPRFRGANALIRSGAALVESGAEVVAALGAPEAARPRPRHPQASALAAEDDPQSPPDDALTARVAALLSPAPVHLNALARLAGASIGATAAAVLELEFAGRAASLPGGYVASGGAAFG